jgi:hypothetical protein
MFAGQLRYSGYSVQFDCSFRVLIGRERSGRHEGYTLVPDPFKPGENEKIISVKAG